METLIEVQTTKKEIYLVQSTSLQNWSEAIELNLEEEEIDKRFKASTLFAYRTYRPAEITAEVLNERDKENIYYVKKLKLF